MTLNKKPLFIALGFAALIAAGGTGIAMADRGPGMPGGEAGMMGLPDFATLDADKDGKVTKTEIEAHRAARFTAADADGNGMLSAAEMVVYQENNERERKVARAAHMIARFDANSDGSLTADEIAAGPRMPDLFERIDADGDGAVTQAEVDAARAEMSDRMGRGGRHGRGPRGGGEGHDMMDQGMMEHGMMGDN